MTGQVCPEDGNFNLRISIVQSISKVSISCKKLIVSRGQGFLSSVVL